MGVPLICYRGREGTKSVIEQELRGIKVGLSAARNLQIKKVQVQIDSNLAVNMLMGSIWVTWKLMNSVSKILSICNNFEKCNISHCFREANRAANCLARRG